MASYLVLNVCVLVAVLIIIGKPLRRPSKVWFGVLGALLILTAIFDNVIVGLGIVDYSSDKILGIYIGIAPVEDFMYAILAAIFIPTVWKKLGTLHVK